RYVVEFLIDNTLGRTWYEMTRGDTSLVEKCRYLVRRPNEIFLDESENAPLEPEESNENLSQEELIKQPTYIRHRPLKDPREILMLDPACGSMHFGLYAFDLFLAIYEEAWDLEETRGADAFKRSKQFTPLSETYEGDKERFLRDVPRLVIENNIHGVDIDPRAVQIAGLSLWLRAQRAWAEQNVKPLDRPQIRRSNIVCAEPMPGETDLLEEFVTKHFSDTPEKRLLGEFVRRIFDSMRLAGEAGSLLKIEEEVAGLISESREQWHKLQQQKQNEHPELFEGARVNIQPGFDFEVSQITDAQFWDRVEGGIYQALRRYSETSEDGAGYQRRLFADDAAQGFAFIDLCRKRYDVVVMNPPFGSPSESFGGKDLYPNAGRDIYAMFVERMGAMRTNDGRVAAILPRTGLFIGTMVDLRLQCYLRSTPLQLLVDLGKDVLDGATIRTACYVIGEKASSVVCLRVGNIQEREARLGELVDSIQMGTKNEDLFIRRYSFFKNVPGFAIAYWIPERLAERLPTLDTLEVLADIRQGIATGDNFRFLRLLSELPASRSGFCFYSKGGEPVPFISDETLYVRADNACAEMKANAAQEYGSASRTIKNEDTFGLPGITYSQVNDAALKFRVHPPNAIYDMKGPVVFPRRDVSKKALLAFLNSSAVEDYMRMMTDGRQWHVSALKNVPVPKFQAKGLSRLADLCEKATRLSLRDYAADEAGHFYHVGRNGEYPQFQQEALEAINAQIDEAVWEDYGATSDEIASFSRQRALFLERTISSSTKESRLSTGVVHFGVGSAFGRWDIRYATGERPAAELPDPFASLPVCPPGMLQNAEGLPAEPKDVPADYPLEIVWNGILVDDAGHAADIENKMREVLQVIWTDRAEAVETEVCEILGVSSLLDYFRKPSGFFADHLKRYSKSRRQAPIYLPLSTKVGGYTLWLYYHRLTDQTLYTCVNDFVEPKLRQVRDETTSLRSKPGRTRDDEKRLENATELVFELEEFRDELLRLAPNWKPNLNDGVQVTVSPLW
ncbi:MAG: BREX-1 system adenine-specific DNA-methyltransferase PglX, partial [Firmicutes bacterium]|nr:BREX-1 system adenine-specific DNA-methyltransferase PglX [Bacillota bacterium]